MIKDKTQEWKALHGRHVRRFFFINQTEGESPHIEEELGTELILHCENMGDRMEMWICKVCTGSHREVSRYNARAVEAIVWADPVDINQKKT